MARQKGPFFIEFTSGNICFYKINRGHYARAKSSLSGERVKKSPRYAPTRVYAALLGESSKIASAVYRCLPKHWRKFWMYQSFVGEAGGLLKQGRTKKETYAVLWNCYAAEFEVGYEEGKQFLHVEKSEPGRRKSEGTGSGEQELRVNSTIADNGVPEISFFDGHDGFYYRCNYWAEAG